MTLHVDHRQHDPRNVRAGVGKLSKRKNRGLDARALPAHDKDGLVDQPGKELRIRYGEDRGRIDDDLVVMLAERP